MSELRRHRVFLFWQFMQARPVAGLAALDESLGIIAGRPGSSNSLCTDRVIFLEIPSPVTFQGFRGRFFQPMVEQVDVGAVWTDGSTGFTAGPISWLATMTLIVAEYVDQH